MKNNFVLTLIQSNLFWQDAHKNMKMFEEKMLQIADNVDLIILPEMFNTGFSMNSSLLYEELENPIVDWMQKIANLKGAAITGSIIVKNNNQYFNHLYFVTPNGKLYHYDKRHLFRMANEHEHFTPGKERLIIDFKGWKICPMICYDLRFPVFSRNRLVDKESHTYDYDLLIYVANWPAARKSAWQTLLEARAHENLCYTVGVNRVGKDGNDIEYSGNSNAFDFKGSSLIQIPNNDSIEFIETVVLSKEELEQYRNKFPAGLDADAFEMLL